MQSIWKIFESFAINSSKMLQNIVGAEVQIFLMQSTKQMFSLLYKTKFRLSVFH